MGCGRVGFGTQEADAGATADADPARDGASFVDGPADCVALAGCTAFTCSGSSSCYQLCAGPLVWSEAEAACEGEGGCLVTVGDTTENDCLTARLGAGEQLFIGWVQSATGAEPADGWHWQCLTSSFVLWGASQPNDAAGEDCGAIGLGGFWSDVSCASSYGYVCETP